MDGVCRQTAGIRSNGQTRQAQTRFEPVDTAAKSCGTYESGSSQQARSTLPPPTAVRSGGLFSLLPDLHLDEDKIIIILLIAVLAKNGADIKLLIALGYLLID